ncbi:MAG: ECF transporter S component [Eubacteriales bacterium]|nr:ECF transporter S component [Eubacteriales bacterium]
MYQEKTATLTANEAKNYTLEQKKTHTHTIAKLGILSCLAFVLMLLEFSVPLMPAFLKFDFSEIPALLASFSMGPLAGVIVEFVKNLLHLPFTTTMCVGELANFIIGSSFVAVAGLIYKKHSTRRAAYLSMFFGTLAMALVGCVFNYFINIPFYVNVMGFQMDAIISLTNASGNTLVHDLPSLITWVFVPFNLIKGAVISVAVGFLYMPLRPLLKK